MSLETTEILLTVGVWGVFAIPLCMLSVYAATGKMPFIDVEKN